jgi:hypothetical protein
LALVFLVSRPGWLNGHGRRAVNPWQAATGRHIWQMSDEAAKPETKQPADPPPAKDPKPAEIGGRKGPDPTRYGDWELNGRCIDF